MKSYFYLAVLLLVFFASCKKKSPEAPFVPIAQGLTVSPTGGPAGTVITLTGISFDPVASNNQVSFGATPVPVQAVSGNSLSVVVPYLQAQGTFEVKVRAGNYLGVGQYGYQPTYEATTLAGNGTPGYQDGPGQVAQFRQPVGLGVDPSGVIYVADASDNRIRRLTNSGNVTTLAGTGLPGNTNDSYGFNSSFNGPTSIASTGSIAYAVDRNNHKIRQITLGGAYDGQTQDYAGTGVPGFANGSGAQFRYPADIVIVDVDGVTSYVCDEGNHSIRKMVYGFASTIAGGGAVVPYAGYKDGRGRSARFNRPSGIALDASGNIYVADKGNHCIRRIVVADSTVSTIAGVPGQAGFQDGAAGQAKFNTPISIDVYGASNTGTLVVADSANNAIRLISLRTGQVITIAGGGSPGFQNGLGSQIKFNGPSAVAFDVTGNILVADVNNACIRRLTPR